MAQLIELGGKSGSSAKASAQDALAELLSDDFRLAVNVRVAEPRGQSFLFDAIVVAPGAIVVLELKDWRGIIRGDAREWVVNGRSLPPPVDLAANKADYLRSRLVSAAPTLADIAVRSRVVLVGEISTLDLADDVRPEVSKIVDAAAHLATEAASSDACLSPEKAELAEMAIRSIGSGQDGYETVGSYEIHEALLQTPNDSRFRARHRFTPSSPDVQIRIVTSGSQLLSAEQLKERREELQRELEAQLHIGAHPNVVGARDLFIDDERLVLVLDHTFGRSLRSILADDPKLDTAESLRLLSGVAAGLEHAHHHHVIHRRVEPVNIVIDQDRTPRLVNFGLAKLTLPDAPTVWHDTAVSTMANDYVAPELYDPRLGETSTATDLYGLGCLAYELLTGSTPFSNPSAAVTGSPPALPDVTDELAVAIQGCVIADPDRRCCDAGVVLATLCVVESRDTPAVPSEEPDHYRPGEIIGNRFEVKELLGSGAFSDVYRVHDPFEGADRALKLLPRGQSHDSVVRELKILRSIHHPRVVEVFWGDQTPSGRWFLVSAYVQGKALNEVLDDGLLELEQALALGDELLAALEAIHPDVSRIAELKSRDALSPDEFEELQALEGSGIVHRDVKPQNIVLTDDGPVLIDFNIASQVGDNVVTESGTKGYMPPDVDLTAWNPDVDLFAAGVVIYELCCGRHPYPDGQPRAGQEPLDPGELEVDVTSSLASVLLRGCAPARADRFATAAEFRAALAAAAPTGGEHTDPGELSDREAHKAALAKEFRNDLILVSGADLLEPVESFISWAESSQAVVGYQPRRSDIGCYFAWTHQAGVRIWPCTIFAGGTVELPFDRFDFFEPFDTSGGFARLWQHTAELLSSLDAQPDHEVHAFPLAYLRDETFAAGFSDWLSWFHDQIGPYLVT